MTTEKNKELKNLRQRIARGNPRPGDKARYKELTGKDASNLKRVSESSKQREQLVQKLWMRIRRGTASLDDKKRYQELTGNLNVKERHQKQKNGELEKKKIRGRIKRGTATVNDEERLKDLLWKNNQPSARATKKRAVDESLSDTESERSVVATREYSFRARKKQAIYVDPDDSEGEDEMVLEDGDDGGNNGSPEGDTKIPAAKSSAESQESDGSPAVDAKIAAAKLACREEIGNSAPSTRVNEQDIVLATTRAFKSASTSVAGAAKSFRVAGSHRKADGGTALLNVAIKQEEGVKQEEEEDAANKPSAESAVAANLGAESAITPDHTSSLSQEDWQQQTETGMAEENQAPHLGKDGRESYGDYDEGDAASQRTTSTVPSAKVTIRFYRKDLDEFIDVEAMVSQDTLLQDAFKSDATKGIRKLSKEQKEALAEKKKVCVLDYVNELKGGRIYRRYRMQELETVSTLEFFETIIPRNQKGNVIDGASHPITFHVHLKDTVAALRDESEEEDCYI